MLPLTVIIAGEPVPSALAKRGDFGRMFQAATGTAWSGAWRTVDARVDVLPEPSSACGLIVSGSPASVLERATWMTRLGEYLCRAVELGVPLLGVCFGHQLLAEALGGRVARNPRGREMGTQEFTLAQNDPVLDDSARPYLVNMSHVDSVVELPRGTVVLGATDLEPHAAFRFEEQAWGVQFHPEFDREIMMCYASDRRAQLKSEGFDADQVARAAQEAPSGAGVLKRFVGQLDSRTSR